MLLILKCCWYWIYKLEDKSSETLIYFEDKSVLVLLPFVLFVFLNLGPSLGFLSFVLCPFVLCPFSFFLYLFSFSLFSVFVFVFVLSCPGTSYGVLSCLAFNFLSTFAICFPVLFLDVLFRDQDTSHLTLSNQRRWHDINTTRHTTRQDRPIPN